MDDMLNKLRTVAAHLSILVVEDEELIRTQLCRYLERFFQRVVEASDGEEGLERYRESGPYDIVISDIRMPRRDGVEMMKVIKETYPEQKFIIASAHSDTNYFLPLIQLGVNHYILKPIDYTQMIDALTRISGELRMEHELNQYKYHLEELVTEQTRELREQLWTDPTTHLPNHIKLQHDLIENAPSNIALFNIDNFSKFNMNFGLRYGDAVLEKVGMTLKEMLEAGMSLYRYTSDEFVVRVDGGSQELLHEKIQVILERFEQKPPVLQQCPLDVTFTVGIAACRDIHCVEHARMAIEGVREVGKRRIALYSETSDFETEKKEMIRWIDEVASALKEKRFVPYFQPIVENSERRIVKYECLARLQLGSGEMASPNLFLPAVEKGGFLPEMSRQIIEKSCAAMSGCAQDFSLNITTQDLKDPSFVTFLETQLECYRIEPQRLTVEVLEGISLHKAERIIERLNAIKELGCKLSIDDFGTEGSNFSRLMDLNVDYIKIDGTFIRQLDHDERSRKITRSIVTFAKSIGCRTIAEYVHNEAIWHEVTGMGIDYSQGYWIGVPERELP